MDYSKQKGTKETTVLSKNFEKDKVLQLLVFFNRCALESVQSQLGMSAAQMTTKYDCIEGFRQLRVTKM